uniref:Uncharacterized protein n=1 Tax=viral metagenome TaxID=1070528 RepID=A0A6H1ZD20_9ZZZZ
MNQNEKEYITKIILDRQALINALPDNIKSQINKVINGKE